MTPQHFTVEHNGKSLLVCLHRDAVQQIENLRQELRIAKADAKHQREIVAQLTAVQ